MYCLLKHISSHNKYNIIKQSQYWYRYEKYLLQYDTQTRPRNFTQLWINTPGFIKPSISYILHQFRVYCGGIYLKRVNTNNRYPLELFQRFFTQIHMFPGVRSEQRGHQDNSQLHTCLLHNPKNRIHTTHSGGDTGKQKCTQDIPQKP